MIFIIERFERLDIGKKKTILNAALEEFAEHGYKNASTNRIVKKASIGKGMLFYYFNTKKDLFNYLVEFAIDYINDEYVNKIDEIESDFIEKFKQAAKIKLKAYHINPHVFNFIGIIYINEDVELTEEINLKLMNLEDSGFSKIFTNLDKSLFRDDLDPDEVIRLIHLTFLGYEKELTSKLKGKNFSTLDMKPYWDDFNKFLARLRMIYYK